MIGVNRVTALALAVAVAVCALLLALSQCDQRRAAGAQSRVDQGQTGALAASAADAVNTSGAAAARETSSETLTRTNEQEIRNATGANQAVDPRVRDAGLRSLCRRAAYRVSERCRLLQHGP